MAIQIYIITYQSIYTNLFVLVICKISYTCHYITSDNCTKFGKKQICVGISYIAKIHWCYLENYVISCLDNFRFHRQNTVNIFIVMQAQDFSACQLAIASVGLDIICPPPTQPMTIPIISFVFTVWRAMIWSFHIGFLTNFDLATAFNI